MLTIVRFFTTVAASAIITSVLAVVGVQASVYPVLWDQQCAVTEPVCILVVPDGSGMSFAEARTITGDVVDATIRVQVWEVDFGVPPSPILGFPAEEITLVPVDNHTAGCTREAVAAADDDTDPEGWTTVSLPTRAGGWSQSPVQVHIMGYHDDSYCECPDLPIYFNSPDLNADRRVNLTDVALFAQDLGADDAPFRSDLCWDGVIDLSDVAIFTQHLGAGCE